MAKADRKRLPPWLRKTVPCSGSEPVRDILRGLDLCTVCASARCPNQAECYGRGRATFLIMGPHCSRSCRFCAVSKKPPAALDPDEPRRVAEAVARLELKHAVVTSVTRDDLPGGGAAHFAETVRATRGAHPCTVEVLTPDFNGDEAAIAAVAEAGPDIFNHNVETAPRLYPAVRPEADYQQSLELLRFLRRRFPGLPTKSGLMLGLGETRAELRQAFRDLAATGCRILTLGQYLAPSPKHFPVARYVPPDEFDDLGEEARAAGFAFVAAAPFVRSSYNAEEVFAALKGAGT